MSRSNYISDHEPYLQLDIKYKPSILIGRMHFVIRAIGRRLEEMEEILRLIAGMEDTHVSYHLIRPCVSVNKVNHFLRTVPPRILKEHARRVDKMQVISSNRMAGTTLNYELWKELQIPVSMKTATLGVGILSAEARIPSAYLASILDIEEQCKSLLRHSTHPNITEEKEVEKATKDWASKAGVICESIEELRVFAEKVVN